MLAIPICKRLLLLSVPTKTTQPKVTTPHLESHSIFATSSILYTTPVRSHRCVLNSTFLAQVLLNSPYPVLFTKTINRPNTSYGISTIMSDGTTKEPLKVKNKRFVQNISISRDADQENFEIS